MIGLYSGNYAINLNENMQFEDYLAISRKVEEYEKKTLAMVEREVAKIAKRK